VRALNVLLAVLVSIVLGVAVLEGGLRLIDKGPQSNVVAFDPELGWSKTPGGRQTHKTGEFKAKFEINELGLRDDPMSSPAKPAGVFRVLMLGDSFTMGYSVSRDDLFVDLLEHWWKAENRNVDVINAGTWGYSTDQEVAWLMKEGAAFQPDLVLLFAYDNDIYWNGVGDYMGKYKPMFSADGQLENKVLKDTTQHTWQDDWAITKTLGLGTKTSPAPEHFFMPGQRTIVKEHAALLLDQPEFMTNPLARTRGALKAFKAECGKLGARAVLVPIPSRSVVDAKHRAGAFSKTLGLQPEQWSPDKPVETFLGLARELSIETLDPRTVLKAANAVEPIYYKVDWHLNPRGNRAFTVFLHEELDRMGAFPETQRGPAGRAVAMPDPSDSRGVPFAAKLFGILWAALTILYLGTYHDEPKWQPPLKIAALLGVIFPTFFALMWVKGQSWGAYAFLAIVAGILGFVAYKLGHRLGTIAELMRSFVARGHWYLMPLVVVLLSIGSLLVVAASSPLIAPFIYTLF
jgi:hypothetical protein